MYQPMLAVRQPRFRVATVLPQKGVPTSSTCTQRPPKDPGLTSKQEPFNGRVSLVPSDDFPQLRHFKNPAEELLDLQRLHRP